MFYPVGSVAPYTVSARILLKNIWNISGQSQGDIRNKLVELLSGLPLLAQPTIPRSSFLELVDQIEQNASVKLAGLFL